MALKVGIIGLGMAVTPHAKSLVDLKDRVESPTHSALRRNDGRASRRAFLSRSDERLETILEDRAVDAVLVLTPPNTHLDIVSRCAKAGKHVLLEKPLEVSTAKAEALVQLM